MAEGCVICITQRNGGDGIVSLIVEYAWSVTSSSSKYERHTSNMIAPDWRFPASQASLASDGFVPSGCTDIRCELHVYAMTFCGTAAMSYHSP